MKKVLLLFLFIFFIASCGKKDLTPSKKTCVINCDDIELSINDTTQIMPSCDVENPNYIFDVDGDSIAVDELGNIVPIETGYSTVTIKVSGYDSEKKITVNVVEPSIVISGPKEVLIDGQITLTATKIAHKETDQVLWSTSDNKIAKVSTKGVVTGIKAGKVTIKAATSHASATYEIEVIRPTATEINCISEDIYEVGVIYNLEFDVEPIDALQEVSISVSNDNLTVNNDNSITANKKGNSVITITSVSNPNLTKNISITILDNEKPQFIKHKDYQNVLDVNFNDKEGLFVDLDVIDNADGDLSSQAIFDEDLLLEYGNHNISITVTDRAGNEVTFTRAINVVWNYNTKFVGHAGCWYGVPNSEEAFIYAAKVLKYQALECDVQITSDGVYVTNHDSYIGDFVINQHTYEEAKKVVTTYGNYTGHVCTLDRYLEICKEYNCEAIIELKGSIPGLSTSSQTKVDSFLQYLKDHKMYDNSIILTSMISVLIAIRAADKNIRLQYLVNSADSDSVLTLCKTYNLDLSTNVTYGGSNSDVWLQKYWDAGLEISVWTFSGEYAQIQKWIDKGVQYVTCDCHDMTRLNLK